MADGNKSPAARSKARRFALQALYQMQMTGCSHYDVLSEFMADHDMKNVDTDLLSTLLGGIEAHKENLFDALTPLMEREADRLDPIERAVLMIGAFELSFCPEVPYRVAIDESIELSKRFGATESHRFINAVLDRLARKIRIHEVV
ncbi:MAG: transcription antitermination factor NusB [Pseudomonadota bacterium]